MAEYAILIYEDEAEWGKTAPEWIQQVAKEHGQFAQQNGVSLRGGSQLQPTMTAKAVRGGTVSDGPMVATTPALSGLLRGRGRGSGCRGGDRQAGPVQVRWP